MELPLCNGSKRHLLAVGSVCLILLFPLRSLAERPPSSSANRESAEAVQIRIGSGNPVAGKDKSQLCQGCHGEHGNSVDTIIPKLSGQFSAYIAKQLRNYQAGVRTHQIMNAMATTVTDEDLADITAYFASQERMSGNHSAENQVGKNLYLKGDSSRNIAACINCHGMNGKGRSPGVAMFPVIGGQHKDYLRKQLLDFRGADRTNSPSGIMNITTRLLNDGEIEALANYLAGL